MSSKKKCSVTGCEDKHYSTGYCQHHYNQFYNGRPLTSKKEIPEFCKIEGCDGIHRSLGYCDKHYMQFYRGHPFTPKREKDRRCSVNGCNEKHYGKGFCAYHYNLTKERVEGLKIIRRRYEKSEKGRKVKSKGWAKRRAREKDAFIIDDFSPQEIFERDGYTCCVCGLPIDVNLKNPDPLRVSLEHKIPLSKGGNHSLENCAPSHILCNLRKGAKLIEPSFEGANI